MSPVIFAAGLPTAQSVMPRGLDNLNGNRQGNVREQNGGGTPALSPSFENNHGADRQVVPGGSTSGTIRAWNGSPRIPNHNQVPPLPTFGWDETPSLPFEQIIQFATPLSVPNRRRR